MVETRNRGEVAPDKKQVNWRIRKDVLVALEADASRRGFPSVTGLLNHLLYMHYYSNESLKGS